MESEKVVGGAASTPHQRRLHQGPKTHSSKSPGEEQSPGSPLLGRQRGQSTPLDSVNSSTCCARAEWGPAGGSWALPLRGGSSGHSSIQQPLAPLSEIETGRSGLWWRLVCSRPCNACTQRRSFLHVHNSMSRARPGTEWLGRCPGLCVGHELQSQAVIPAACHPWGTNVPRVSTGGGRDERSDHTPSPSAPVGHTRLIPSLGCEVALGASSPPEGSEPPQ